MSPRAGIVIVWMAVSIAAHAATSSRFTQTPCLTQTGEAAGSACEKLAQEVSHDIGAVRALGEELERSGRFEDAETTYRVALTVHPEHRDLLQRMIRARAQARSLRLLSAPADPAPASLTATSAAKEPERRAEVKAARTQPIDTKPIESKPVEARPTGRNLALLIGNEQYSHFNRLRTPSADARAMARLLEREYGFETNVLTNATRYEIVTAMSQLRRTATEADSVLIYYAGHGYLDDATARGYWLPVDAERDNIANWLSSSDITDVLAGLQARHALILADSCFSGALLRADPTVTLDERQSLLQKLAARRSRSIMTSGGLEPVIDGGGEGHSVFAAALIRALTENRRTLEAGKLFIQIRERVALGASQTPQYGPLRNAGHDGGDFIFSRKTSKR